MPHTVGLVFPCWLAVRRRARVIGTAFSLSAFWLSACRSAPAHDGEQARATPVVESTDGARAALVREAVVRSHYHPAGTDAGECAKELPPLPSVPRAALRVTSFGAIPDDEKDDGPAIRRALKALRPGGFLVFPPGRYIHDGVIRVRTQGAVLWGFGATLHAADLREQAIMLEADGASLYGFTLTAVARERLEGGPACARVAVVPPSEQDEPVVGNRVRHNAIVPAGGSRYGPLHGAGGAGIFVFRARDFIVANNHVERTLADGIHVTGGSAHGVVVGNVVRHAGDDGIAVVSYCPTRKELTASRALAEKRVAAALVRDVLIAGNAVRDQAWGRGLSVVGGAEVTLERNRVDGVPFAAGILVAREDSYHTCGAQDIVVRNNEVSAIQVEAPQVAAHAHAYPQARTGHAAIEVHAFASKAEREARYHRRLLRVGPVLVQDNVIQRAAFDGVRVMDGSRGDLVSDIQIIGNRVTDVGEAWLHMDEGISYRAERNQSGDRQAAEEVLTSTSRARGASQRCDALGAYPSDAQENPRPKRTVNAER